MKVKVISRSLSDVTRERTGDNFKIQRNLDPVLHPFERAREYTRALNAVKLERLFAKPFLGSLEGHIDGVYCMAKSFKFLRLLASASADGQIRLWDLAERRSLWTAVNGHEKFIKGICFVDNEMGLLSCGDDKVVKLWNPNNEDSATVSQYLSRSPLTGIDHQRGTKVFATSGSCVELWHRERSDPIQTFSWSSDTVTSVKFNQVETNVMASVAYDRSVILYDIRAETPLHKVVLSMRSNAVCWNPMEAFYFTVANEDHNCYTFDMRRMGKAVNVLKDHVSAVLDLDYSPTGREIVTGAYDKSMRIFNATTGHSRDIYHTKRMQRVFCVKVSMDGQYCLSGSDDGNIRLWKMDASRKIALQSPRELAAVNYNRAVKTKFRSVDEIKRIDKHRFVPKPIKSAARTKREMVSAAKKREENERKHSKIDTRKQTEREKSIITTVK